MRLCIYHLCCQVSSLGPLCYVNALFFFEYILTDARVFVYIYRVCAYMRLYVSVCTHTHTHTCICSMRLHHLPLCSYRNFTSLLINNEYFHQIIYSRCPVLDIHIIRTICFSQGWLVYKMLALRATQNNLKVSKRPQSSGSGTAGQAPPLLPPPVGASGLHDSALQSKAPSQVQRQPAFPLSQR